MSEPDRQDDMTLVTRCLRGDAGGWEALVNRYQRLVYTIVLRIGLDEHAAADVFQTVFARLIKHLPGLREPHRLQAWIVTTAKREALRQRTRGQRTISMSAAGDDNDDPSPEWDLPDETALPEEALAELQVHDSVRRGLDRLDQRCRELLTLLFQDDDEKVSYDEVARRLGIPVGSIGPTRSRCLGKLRDLVE